MSNNKIVVRKTVPFFSAFMRGVMLSFVKINSCIIFFKFVLLFIFVTSSLYSSLQKLQILQINFELCLATSVGRPRMVALSGYKVSHCLVIRSVKLFDICLDTSRQNELN